MPQRVGERGPDVEARIEAPDYLLLCVLGDEEQLRPREDVVKVVLHLVVLGEAREVAVLHLEEVIHRGIPYAHHRPPRLLAGRREDAVPLGVLRERG